jgi:FtsP/CotA-like multicopper oxidase with cupredoxin domain
LINPGGGWVHPVHIHLVDLQLLDRNGRPPLPYERGWKDVFLLGDNETLRVITKFGPNPGKYMIHCHNIVHEDRDMMTQFEVGKGGDDPMLAPAKPISEIRPL